MSETASRNALVKFDAVLLKRYPEQLEGFADETFGEDEREAVQAVVALVDSVYVPLLQSPEGPFTWLFLGKIGCVKVRSDPDCD